MFRVSTHQPVWILAAILVLLQTAPAQRKGNSGTPHNTPSIPRTPAPYDGNLQPVFISGRVALEGGGTLSEPVAIERICNGLTRREGYTDFKGQFQLQIGQNIGFQDASESDPHVTPGTNLGLPAPGQSSSRQAMNLQGCELRAVLAGFQSSTIRLQPSISSGPGP